ncbi:MAG: septum formation protein Maf [Alphaproteobacteria bacterium]|nr:septum formation protein Maf [Alphaproteobacteria bacterium]
MQNQTEVRDFILASGSPQRIALLRQVDCEPKKIQPADIDENCLPHEMPLPYVRRMALEKARHVATLCPNENILACDTIVAVGQRILHKAKDVDEQRKYMKLLSGRTHRVISSVCLIDKNGKISQRTVTTKIAMKVLSEEDLKEYLACGEWKGVCGYKIEGRLAGYVTRMVGSYSGVVGLPLYETTNLLKGAGVK